MTAFFTASADGWHRATAWDDCELAERVAADGIDILIDLSGHTGGNRLLAFARKPAPLALTWLGYFNTTGLDAMDYLVADGTVCPEEDRRKRFVEKVLRLPGCYLCYRGPRDAPAVAPAPSGRPVVFGCFNNASKITPQVCETWSRILLAVPGSRLMLKAASLADAEVRDRLAREFRTLGVGGGRLDLRGPSPQGELLAQYGEVDVALDPFPYNGGTTTCEALWMGVPVVTLTGDRFAGRVGTSILAGAGFTEGIAASPAEYVETAIRLAGDPGRREILRLHLREQVSASVLGDTGGFTRKLENAYRQIWTRWCEEARS
jgi:predicted O-linked N-acetylglucosamine transferase (SPINDLY family)